MNSNFRLFAGTVLAAVAIGMAMNFKAIRRYIRISTM